MLLPRRSAANTGAHQEEHQRLMKRHSDHDGKSKTASAVDAERYPEQHEVHDGPPLGNTSEDEIARRAYQLWRERGCPEGSAQQDWFEAAEQLRAHTNSAGARSASRDSGSVQP